MQPLGVLVAGGQGSRLGDGGPKALALCGGRTFLERALELLETLCDPVVVVAPASMRLPVPAARRVADPPGAAGPLAAVVAGFAGRTFEDALVLAVDFPLLTSAALKVLLEARGSAACVLAAPGGVPQPLAAWYAARALEPLAASLAAGERSITVAVMALGPVLVDDVALAKLPGGAEVYLNVNTPEDLARAERLLATRSDA